MAHARTPLYALLVLSAACGGASSSPTSTSTSPPRAWTELRVSWDYGPCPANGRSCHQTLSVKPDGGFVAAETPNPAAPGASIEPIRRFDALDRQEIRELQRIVDAPEFFEKVGAFGCPPEYDATIRIELQGPWGVRKEEIGGCVHAAATTPNASRALVELLERHRFATHDEPATHTTPPSGQGDSCTASVGCGKGFVCMIAPCVVAPCLNGSCQKSGP